MKIMIESQKNYELPAVKAIIDRIFAEFALINKLQECRTVLLKPNLLGAYAPSRAVTTHPVVIEAVIIKLQELGKEVWLGDSPGGSLPVSRVWQVTGIDELCSRYGVRLLNFNTAGISEHKLHGESYQLAESFFTADAVISLAKYKTHSLMNYTGCIKNLYGLVPGLKKSDYHSRYPTYNDFKRVITDIYEICCRRIVLHILDGIDGMEGEGPSAGIPRNYGILLASVSGAALDVQAAGMLGFKREQLAYLYECLNMEQIPEQEISVDTRWQKYVFPNVKIRKVNQIVKMIQHSPRFMQDIFRSIYKFYPDFNDNCRLCGVCKESCPVQAITMTEGAKTPVIDYAKCIKCMCCHELCPYQAVYIHKSFLARFLVK
ncbi:MAG: DUF362 domain-containing protein [Candidatus Cloacimonetes bacterium]|nr:DUF362 domain-containing protein [Candidatus Cloacimonadota bacterium]